jgi:branched-chain amino acid aminotransferase
VIVWVDGRLTDAAEARISPVDHGLLTGDGVFETLRVYAGTPFAWRRHLERLAHSATGLGLAMPDPATVRRAAADVLEANDITEGRLRVTVTGGPAPLGSERGSEGPTVIVAAGVLRPWPPAEAVVLAPWPRNERGALAGLKTISYAENVRALAYASDHEATEAVFANTRGELCEATGSNVFLVSDGVLRTPPGSAGCLLGVTRALILEVCAALSLPAEEVSLPVGALARADEAFLTSTTREVQPIASVDGTHLGATPGRVTTCLAAAFRDLVARDLDP